jgi:hypothetical protein
MSLSLARKRGMFPLCNIRYLSRHHCIIIMMRPSVGGVVVLPPDVCIAANYRVKSTME